MATHPKFIAAQYRAKPISDYMVQAEAIVESGPVIGVYASCEWDCLDENGKEWVAAIVREAMARAAENGL